MSEPTQALHMQTQALLASLREAAFALDGDAHVVAWNAAATALYGYSEDEARGLSLWRLLPGLDAEPCDPVCVSSRARGGNHLELAASLSEVAGDPPLLVAIVRPTPATPNEALERLAGWDPLTGLLNRRNFDSRLPQEVSRSRRYGPGLALLLLDIDHFSEINRRCGRESGDAVLRFIAEVIIDATRTSDWSARISGDRFAVCLPEVDASGALLVAERIRRTVEETPAPRLGETQLTVSIGVAVFDPARHTAQGLTDEADSALYQAKEQGRNRIVPLQPMVDVPAPD